MSFVATRNQTIAGIVLAITTTMVWSGNFIVARAVKNDIPPVTLAFFRWLTASAIMLPFAVKQMLKEWPLIKTNWPLLFFAALTGVCLFNTFVYMAGHYSTAINLALVGTTSSPVISIILAYFFLKEKLNLLKVLGLLICIVGIALLVSKGNLSNLWHLQFGKGDVWVLLGAFSFAVYNIITRKKPAALSNTAYLAVIFWIGTLLLFPAYLWEHAVTTPVVWNTQNLLMIFYLGAGASVFSFLCWNAAIHKLGAGRTALFGNLIPIFSTLEAAVLLHEQVAPYHFISFIVIISGLLIANLKAKQPAVTKNQQ
jgi:drug/metabolite transporter (DMT)-like permease